MITTVIGNFPKVAEGRYGTKVIGAMSRWQRQELTDAELEQIFQEVTREAIAQQEEAGIDLLTDGQIRWEDLVTPLARKIEGFEINGLERFFDNNVYYRKPILHATPIRRRPIFLGDYLFARSCTKRPLKVVLPGPYTVVALSENRYYKNQVRPFLRSIAEILNEEAKTLEQAGALMIQFDEPALGFGTPPMKQVVEAINIATHGLKAKTALMTYFGRLNGALGTLQRCRVDVIGVDVVSDPTALAAVKRQRWTKELAIGCLDARNTKLESVPQLHRVFGAVARCVPPDRLYVNPNCGLEFLPYEQACHKLNRLVEAARSYAA